MGDEIADFASRKSWFKNASPAPSRNITFDFLNLHKMYLLLLIPGYLIVAALCWFVLPFTGHRRTIFSFTIFPVLAVGAFLSIAILDQNFPGIVGSFDALMNMGTRQGTRSALLYPVMLLAPGMGLVGVCWLFVFWLWEKKAKSADESAQIAAQIRDRIKQRGLATKAK